MAIFCTSFLVVEIEVSESLVLTYNESLVFSLSELWISVKVVLTLPFCWGGGLEMESLVSSETWPPLVAMESLVSSQGGAVNPSAEVESGGLGLLSVSYQSLLGITLQ